MAASLLAMVFMVLVISVPLSFSEKNDLAPITLDGMQFENPCKNTNCPSGEECTVQYTPRLIKIPIAHCVRNASELKEGTCREYSVGTSILNCKSETEWNSVGGRQCPLRVEGATLVGTEVKNPCPARKKSGEVTFLTATFNCCSTEDRPKQNIGYNVKTTERMQDIQTTEKVPQDIQTHRDYTIPICFGVTLILALLLVLTAIGIRCRHKRHPKQIQQSPSNKLAMTIVNPHPDVLDVDMLYDCNDKSLLTNWEPEPSNK